MSNTIINTIRVLITFLIAVGIFAIPSPGQTKNRPPTQNAAPKNSAADDNENLVYQALRQIVGAQVTYSAVSSSGNYALNLQALADFEFTEQVPGGSRKIELIDQILGSGEKYGYYFWVTATSAKNGQPASFTATATPSQYPKTGRRSFYIDETGVIRGADRNGAIASTNDPVFIICGEGESEVVESLRTIYGAEITYQAAVGNGNFGTLKNLQSSGLIDSVTSSGNRCGYRFIVVTTNGFPNNPASFYIAAVPQKSPAAGRRSFRIDLNGVVRGADKNGAVAAVNAPIVITCGGNETAAIASLRTLHGAEITYRETIGNGNYGSLSELRIKQLVTLSMSQGNQCGYRFILKISEGKRDNPTTFNITAVPQKYVETGRRSFYIDESGIIRGADRSGQPADADDLPLEN